MKQLDFQRHTYQNSREWIIVIKATAWLVVLFYGNPSLQSALVGLIERLG
jgi:hypothetical protein